MKHPNGFVYWQSIPFDAFAGYGAQIAIARAVFHKLEARDPRIAETHEVRPLVWDRTYPDLVRAATDEANRRARRVTPRLARFMAYAERCNREHLATLTPEQALAAFEARASSALKWFEVLPPGIDYQTAADATGIDVHLSWWEGNVLRSWSYHPGGSKPRKFRQVAKAI